jgi:hypothetical protein
VASLHSAAAPEQRDGVENRDGQFDRVSDPVDVSAHTLHNRRSSSRPTGRAFLAE